MKMQLGQRTIDCHVAYGSGSKIVIHIASSGFIEAKAPNGTSDEAIVQAVTRQQARIEARLDALERAQEAAAAPAVPNTYDEQRKVLHLGRYYQLSELIDTTDGNEEELKLRLKRFYFRSCKEVVLARMPKYQNQLKLAPKSVEVVESKTKWGSCSSTRQLTFNYLLAMAPVEIIDYVIVHELCHLAHMNHDRSFWRRVGSIMPDYKDREAFLDRYGHAMTM